MASQRCSPCDLNLPTRLETCPVCGKETWRVADDWTPDWEFEVAKLKALRRAERGDPIPNIENSKAPVFGREEDPGPFVPERVLIQGGVYPEIGGIVLLNDRYYELIERRFGDKPIPAWMVEEIDVELEFADLPVAPAEQDA